MAKNPRLIYWTILFGIIFFLLSPGNFVSIPSSSSSITEKTLYATAIFTILFYVIHIIALYFGIK